MQPLQPELPPPLPLKSTVGSPRKRGTRVRRVTAMSHHQGGIRVCEQVVQLCNAHRRIDRQDARPDAVQRQEVEKEFRPVIERDRDPMAGTISGRTQASGQVRHHDASASISEGDSDRRVVAACLQGHMQEIPIRVRCRGPLEKRRHRIVVATRSHAEDVSLALIGIRACLKVIGTYAPRPTGCERDQP